MGRLLITHRSSVIKAEAVCDRGAAPLSVVRSCRPRSAAGTRYEQRSGNHRRVGRIRRRWRRWRRWRPATLRADGRSPDERRAATFERDFTVFAAGSVLVTTGRTKVLCTASVEDRVPPWLRGGGKGWVTAEYSLLPGSSAERIGREAAKGRQSGRTQEIQRLIGRSLRAVTDLVAMGELQVTVDCDVLQADGGTRTAGICGAYVALHDCFTRLMARGDIRKHPITDACGAVSVGVVDGACLLDLDYSEDARAEVDMNVVMTGSGRFIEVQGTAEGMPFSRGELEEMLALAERASPSSSRPSRPSWRSRPSRDEQSRDEHRVAMNVRSRNGSAPLKFVLATANPDKASEIMAVVRDVAGDGIVLVDRPPDRPRGRRDRRHARRERLLEGARARGRDRAARDRRRHGSRGRRSRRGARRALVAVLGRARVHTPTTWRSCCRSSSGPARRPRRAQGALPHGRAGVLPGRQAARCEGATEGRDSPRGRRQRRVRLRPGVRS